MTLTNASRPLPGAGSELLARFSDDVEAVIVGLRTRILQVAPQAHEHIVDVGYTVSLRYGSDASATGAFVYVAGFSKHANLGFVDGASLPDPMAVLEGDGARMRHAKFRSIEDLAAPWIEDYLEAALREAGFDRDVGDGKTTVKTRAARSLRTDRLTQDSIQTC